ncbi:hypothetical protein E2C01_008174 [Portunus trituberculatus]|uniref:Uncharacterized protein n=1 Tax=Portunus trituberculatus TaxID=210409 RepID=A0A5B7D383_PORTR|nr:hypothetical protein [Portunus trituberculatus]
MFAFQTTMSNNSKINTWELDLQVLLARDTGRVSPRGAGRWREGCLHARSNTNLSATRITPRQSPTWQDGEELRRKVPYETGMTSNRKMSARWTSAVSKA